MQNKTFYLTFDGAVNPPGTLHILDDLEKHNVRASFFVEGHRIKGHEDVLLKMHKSGHHIGNHSFTHPDFSTLSTEKCMQEVKMTEDALFAALDFRTPLLRPPSGILPDSHRKVFEDSGYRICLWSISVADWLGPDARAVAERTISQAKDDVITAVFHDHLETTAETADIIITQLKELGYSICPIPYR